MLFNKLIYSTLIQISAYEGMYISLHLIIDMSSTFSLSPMSPNRIILESRHIKRKSSVLKFDVTHINSPSQIFVLYANIITCVLRHSALVWHHDYNEERRFMIYFEFHCDTVNFLYESTRISACELREPIISSINAK